MLNIEAYSIEEGIDVSKWSPSFILVSDLVVYTYIKNLFHKETEMIYLVYTYSLEHIKELNGIKKGSRVLFVEANEHLAMTSIKIIEKLNIGKFDIVPYFSSIDSQENQLDSIEIAITPDVTSYIPNTIKKIINIGSKMIDISVIRYIMVKYNLESCISSDKIAYYTKETIPIENYNDNVIDMMHQFNNKYVATDAVTPAIPKKSNQNKGYSVKWSFKDIIYNSKVMGECIRKAYKIANTDQTTLIIGETGTGKEMFANSIHNASNRKKNPFIAINCASLSESVLESELFGYEYGAFTGAKKDGRKGLFELANKGTIFLDEIGEISLNFQSKLLRVLQEREIMKIGGNSIIPIDVRVIAATNKNLRTLVEQKKFREDLYYRLNIFTIIIPSLRERKEDIPLLINEFMKNHKCNNKIISDDLMELLIQYKWGGNVRELKNCLEYMIYMGGEKLTISDLPPYIHSEQKYDYDAEHNSIEFNELYYKEKELVTAIIEICSYRNVGRRNLHSLLNEHGYKISEYKLRNILDLMRKKGIICFGKGRQGIQVIRRILE